MMAWTDRHCRRLHRAFTPNALLYTEMITTGALLRGPGASLLAQDSGLEPVAVQLGGSEPADLAACAKLAAAAGFQEINLNVGCPSPRVKRGAFGACLMREPDRVRTCVAAMIDAVDIPVTVKCRLGVDEDDSPEFLHAFVESAAAGGARKFVVHARKALLNGLTPAQNRLIPPLDYTRVHDLVSRYPALRFEINGGFTSVAAVVAQTPLVHGVMVGRAAYQNPWLLAELDAALYGSTLPESPFEVLTRLLPDIERALAQGVRLHSMTRHMLGVFSGFRGARRYRQILSTAATQRAHTITPLMNALERIAA